MKTMNYTSNGKSFQILFDEHGVIDTITRISNVPDGSISATPLAANHPDAKILLNNHDKVAAGISFGRFNRI